MKLPNTLACFAIFIATVQPHGVFSTVFIDGMSQGDGKCLRTSFAIDDITSPVTDLTSPEMACGIAGQTPAADTCTLKANQKLSWEFRLWASGSPPGTIDGSHLGPMAIYAKSVKNTSDDPTGTGWFKLWDYGYDEASQTWATEKLIANDGIVSMEIPATMPSGQYFIRMEIIALHNLAAGPAQFYIGCTQVSVEGSSSALDVPSDDIVSIPGYIQASDPAVNFNSHPDAEKHFPYILGGPSVYEFSGTKETTDIVFSPLDAALSPHTSLGPTSTSSANTPSQTPTAAMSSTATASASSPTSTPDSSGAGGVNKGFAVSGNGSCGEGSGYMCSGSVYGDCCSASGWCGSTSYYCGEGCQSQFGSCT
ncbi:glycosyl hydrolase family 61-domain-containing protein [Xylariaceae sp. FL1019]|nr:glycosyl hydrolase family 61-domain-containing protein [Xylariaceae sp. FL1019]